MVTVNISPTKSIEIGAAKDGAGVTLTIKTLFGTFTDIINQDQANAVIFGLEQAVDDVEVIRARKAHEAVMPGA